MLHLLELGALAAASAVVAHFAARAGACTCWTSALLANALITYRATGGIANASVWLRDARSVEGGWPFTAPLAAAFPDATVASAGFEIDVSGVSSARAQGCYGCWGSPHAGLALNRT